MSELSNQMQQSNEVFAAEQQKKGNLDEVSKYPSRSLAILTCMDTRLVDFLEPALGLKRGEAKIIKVAGNTAGRGFDSVIGSLMVAVYELGVKEIFVIGHEDCGMFHTTSAELGKKMFEAGISEDVIDALEPQLMSWCDMICDSESSVMATVRNLCHNPYLPKGIIVHGGIIHPKTGEIRFIMECEKK